MAQCESVKRDDFFPGQLVGGAPAHASMISRKPDEQLLISLNKFCLSPGAWKLHTVAARYLVRKGGARHANLSKSNCCVELHPRDGNWDDRPGPGAGLLCRRARRTSRGRRSILPPALLQLLRRVPVGWRPPPTDRARRGLLSAATWPRGASLVGLFN